MLDRVVPAACGAASCALLSLAWAGNMSARCVALQDWIRILHRMEGELMLHNDMSALMEAACKGEENKAVRSLRECAQKMRADPRLTAADVAGKIDYTPLKKSDVLNLTRFWHEIGKAEGDQSAALLQKTMGYMESQLQEAETLWDKNRRLAGTLGGFGALAIFLFLL